MTRKTLALVAGLEKSSNVESIRFLRMGTDALPDWFPHCPRGGIDGDRRRKFYRAGPGASRWINCGGSGRNRFLVCRRAAVDCSAFLPGREAHPCALPAAAAARGCSWSSCRYLVAPFVEPRRGKPSGDPNPGCHPGGVILRDLYPSRAKSLVRREEPSLASLAGSAHRSGVGIFIRGRWSAWNGSAVELFRNDPGASRGNGFALWIGAGGDRQRFPLEFWLDQHPDTFRASARWRSGSGRWLLASAESSCQQAEDGGCHGRDLCRIATGLDRKPYTR